MDKRRKKKAKIKISRSFKKKKECKLFEEPVYIVEWEDAHTVNETMGERDIKEESNIKVKTTGYLVDENDDRIAICGFRFGEGKNAGYRDSEHPSS